MGQRQKADQLYLSPLIEGTKTLVPSLYTIKMEKGTENQCFHDFQSSLGFLQSSSEHGTPRGPLSAL